MKSTQKFFLLLIASAFILRVTFSFYQAFNEKIDTYEYGAIAQNLVQGKGYSLFYNDEGEVGFKFKTSAHTYQSAWMPPLYVYFLVPFYLVDSDSLRLFLIFLTQSVLSILTILFIYKLTEISFNPATAIIASSIYAFLPEFIFASATIGPTIFYHILLVLILYYLLLLKRNESFKNIVIIGFLFGAILLLRSELVLFLLIVILLMVYRNKYKTAFYIFLLTILSLLPWQIRNYVLFERVIPFTTSSGLNFYRGHNQFKLGDWKDPYTENEIKNLIKYDNYELKVNELYFSEAIKSIKQNPFQEIKNSVIKISQLWIFNIDNKHLRNPFYILPWLLILALALTGLIKHYDWNRYEEFYLFLISTTIVAVLFFVIPRYQTMFKIILLPFTAHSLIYYYNKYKSSASKV
ncbi:MAG TPA: glycosyltransferase family 39 protein [Ignavibacteriaceae bacterium]|nr:glycosyltransferase family 39 protein [Ignavibacteriaceae bacterium]